MLHYHWVGMEIQDALMATKDTFLSGVWEGSFLLDEDEILLYHLIPPWGVCGGTKGPLTYRRLYSGLILPASTGVFNLQISPTPGLGYIRQKETPGNSQPGPYSGPGILISLSSLDPF